MVGINLLQWCNTQQCTMNGRDCKTRVCVCVCVCVCVRVCVCVCVVHACMFFSSTTTKESNYMYNVMLIIVQYLHTYTCSLHTQVNMYICTYICRRCGWMLCGLSLTPTVITSTREKSSSQMNIRLVALCSSCSSLYLKKEVGPGVTGARPRGGAALHRALHLEHSLVWPTHPIPAFILQADVIGRQPMMSVCKN